MRGPPGDEARGVGPRLKSHELELRKLLVELFVHAHVLVVCAQAAVCSPGSDFFSAGEMGLELPFSPAQAATYGSHFRIG